MVVMTFARCLGRFGGLGRFEIVLQAGEGFLGTGKIAGFQGGGQVLEIIVSLVVRSKWLGGRGL
jgi:hypothetical protein